MKSQTLQNFPILQPDNAFKQKNVSVLDFTASQQLYVLN